MATMQIYGGLGYHLMREDFNPFHSTGTEIKVALLENTYSFSQTHTDWSQVSGHQISSATYPDYAAGGVEITGKEVAYNSGNGESTFSSTAGKVQFTPDGNIKAAYAVIYDDTPASASAKKLLACIDFGGEEESVDGKFEIIWHGDGILRLGAI